MTEATQATTAPTPAQRERLQLIVSADAYMRIHVAAKVRRMSPGELVSELARRHLPPVPGPPPSGLEEGQP